MWFFSIEDREIWYFSSSSLPYRQLRKIGLDQAMKEWSSLPYRQLRNGTAIRDKPHLRSLPYRQLRNFHSIALVGFVMFTAVQAA